MGRSDPDRARADRLNERGSGPDVLTVSPEDKHRYPTFSANKSGFTREARQKIDMNGGPQPGSENNGPSDRMGHSRHVRNREDGREETISRIAA